MRFHGTAWIPTNAPGDALGKTVIPERGWQDSGRADSAKPACQVVPPSGQSIFIPDDTGRTIRFDTAAMKLLVSHSCDGRVHSASDGAILVRGALAGHGLHPSPESIYHYYREHGQLPIDRLEGSFTIVLVDGRAGRVILFRNLVGGSFTYYTKSLDGFHFASNLAELVRHLGSEPRANHEVLPAYFLYRFVPGRLTLFENIYRLLPGEQVIFDRNGVHFCQVQTFAQLRGTRCSGADIIDQIETTTREVLAGWAEDHPWTGNLLSGGVDSSYLQAIWNRVVSPSVGPPCSFSVCVDHPRTRPDTDYALTAAKALGCRHTLIPANDHFAGYLYETIAATGEPPNHAFVPYFGLLARSMKGRGFTAGLCGEGADSLFGTSLADLLRTAAAIRRWIPWSGIRQFGAWLATAAGRDCLPAAFRLADHVHDAEDVEHPVNRIAVFTDWPAVQASFGDDGIAQALAYRRSLVNRLAVGDDPLDVLHMAGYLGEATDSAALWTTLFHASGIDLFCPFLDSRLLRLAWNFPPGTRYPYRRPKDLLRRALVRYVPRPIAYRPKLGFGQPVFEWLSPGGQLRPWVEQLGRYDFVAPAALNASMARPNWFLWSLLCYDIWHRLFIDREVLDGQFTGTILPPLRRGGGGGELPVQQTEVHPVVNDAS